MRKNLAIARAQELGSALIHKSPALVRSLAVRHDSTFWSITTSLRAHIAQTPDGLYRV